MAHVRSRTRRLGAVAAVLLASSLAALGCADVAEPTDGVRGILRFESSATATAEGPSDVTDGSIETPDTVRVGERFTAAVSTVGLDGCWQPVGQTLSVEGLTAEVVPFDADRGDEGRACTQALVSLDHPVRLSFDEPGEAVVRVEGRRVVGRDQGESEPLTLEATVTVVP